jgi:hypothetical protein
MMVCPLRHAMSGLTGSMLRVRGRKRDLAGLEQRLYASIYLHVNAGEAQCRGSC